MKRYIKEQLTQWDVHWIDIDLLAVLIHAVILIVGCLVFYYITRQIVLVQVHRIARKSKTHWDDRLLEAHFFRRIVLLLPLFIVRASVNIVMEDFDAHVHWVSKFFDGIILLAVMRIILAFINALREIMRESESYRDKPLDSYAQVVKITIYFFFGILIFSLITGRSPWFFITTMGAASAILLLVFRDTILGFIGSIQLTSNDMVRIGDWISMEKYGADGNVIEINLTTIKVRNFDLTITTIPTYALISDSFKNWRGMQESEGRRIKRAVRIATSSIRFVRNEELEQFKEFNLLAPYISQKEEELAAHNAKLGATDTQINGRTLTNIGLYRKYIERYLQENAKINKELTCMVRQLEPDAQGLPIEIYAFSKIKEWELYEGIIADIFDHVLAITPRFGLAIFQNPTGDDFAPLRQ